MPSDSVPVSPANHPQGGYVLIAALAMLTALLGVVLLCLYPLAEEERLAPRHRETLRRIKAAERGFFGRLADQPGGVQSACGGFFSDTGTKMIVHNLATDPQNHLTLLERALEFWYYRRSSNLAVFNERSSDGENNGYNDIYRYDRQKGFWVGYRGKRYVIRPSGEEHERRNCTEARKEAKECPDIPRFYDAGDAYLQMHGSVNDRSEPFCLTTEHYSLGRYPSSRIQSPVGRIAEYHRYYNPVERLEVRVNDRRTIRTTDLTARLVYAKQPDPENAPDPDPDDLDSFAPYLPHLPPEVLSEAPFQTETSDNTISFFFWWDPTNLDDPATGISAPRVCEGHTFEIGLKKLVLLEEGLPVFTCGITIPPAREYQCEEVDHRPNYRTGCAQPYSDQYVVEIDYDG